MQLLLSIARITLHPISNRLLIEDIIASSTSILDDNTGTKIRSKYKKPQSGIK